uniref:CUB domain-containing protein n=1 Tax=Panagrellus redivivus TaxID=6233 RepID=A0A7E4V7I2_PANRE
MHPILPLFAILTQVRAADIVKYAKGGALITGLGTVELDNPQPVQFEIDDIDSCSGMFWVCYQRTVSNDELVSYCDSGYCPININYEQKLADGFKEVVDGNNVKFTLDVGKEKACPADTTDGYQSWQIFKIPTGCDVIILGATDPMGTAKMTFYILGGAAGVILLISIGAVVYLYFFRRPKIQEFRNSQHRTTW